ncbi:MAG: integrase core domain-containing protein, partial [Psychromonas sp.]|nr:integrase core domain-containing protein [Psychromonas sp.]
SDQGVQYSANLFKNCLSLHCITQSMSRRGNCWDNVVQERFFRSLKREYLNGLSFINHDAVIQATVFYIRYYIHHLVIIRQMKQEEILKMWLRNHPKKT